ncbi:hypothetical protein H6P81_001032 [Aristolochia fimbriata]|uniref:Uncharacterized protein n=1 Tax=Aristolochia fimbriata TaxID=158543 RepID=A0AAV7F6G5_ARIFI|nr:hypothetical protein H6P81_001032 [Aristolochia fimbriata]
MAALRSLSILLALLLLSILGPAASISSSQRKSKSAHSGGKQANEDCCKAINDGIFKKDRSNVSIGDCRAKKPNENCCQAIFAGILKAGCSSTCGSLKYNMDPEFLHLVRIMGILLKQ